MAELQIDDLIRGVATGTYIPRLGSQFGSIWGFDGLMAAEATPEEYAAFGAQAGTKLCHGASIAWLGREWSSILTYTGGKLRQVSIHTDADETIFVELCALIAAILGKGESLGSDQRAWNALDGVATVTQAQKYVQLSIGKYSRTRGTVASILRFFGINAR